MYSVRHLVSFGAVSVLLLSACDAGGESGTSFGLASASNTNTTGSTTSGGNTGTSGLSPPPAAQGTGTKNTVVATSSVPGTVSATAGSNQTVSVTFTSSDGRPIHGLAISSTTLPTNWSGIDGYSCTLVGTGSSCVLNLTYSPTAAESGSVAIAYEYINNANQPIAPGGTVTIPYVATTPPNNNVVAVSSPTGQIVSSLGSAAQPVAVNFTTDDGNAATNLTLTTDLSSLPAGWTSTKPGLTCAIVSAGNGCQLMLSFLPKSAATGTLALAYSYSDSSGLARTGTLNVPYSSTTNGTVVATAAPSGQVNAVQKTGSQTVTLTFTTDDGKTASNLMLLSDLTKLPAGWSSSNQFSCGSVSTGNGCQLTLKYAPSTIASGTISLDYSYRDAGGTYNVGSLNVPYASTTDDNVVGTPSPSGQISTVVGDPSPTVTVTFASDDGRPATALQVTTDLTTLPGGWTSGVSSLNCSGVNGGTSCQLPLTYTPTNADSGTLALAYKYVNDAGKAKTGTVNIPYVATTNNKVLATSSATSLSVLTASTTPVTVTFVTDDGNPASDLQITAGLLPLPLAWTSSASTFGCSTISTGTGCQLSLGYAPLLADVGLLTLQYSYTNNSGVMKSDAIAIGYTAALPPP